MVDKEPVREVNPDEVGDMIGVGVEEGGKVVVGKVVAGTERVGEILLDNESMVLNVGGNVEEMESKPLVVEFCVAVGTE